jgi:hypothetical protein
MTRRPPFLATWSLASALFLVACGGAPQPDLASTDTASDSIEYAPKTAPTPYRERIDFDTSLFPAPPKRDENSVVVSVLLPIGDARDNISKLSSHLYNAAQLALFDAGQNGQIRQTFGASGSQKTNFVLRLHDTKGTPAGAAQAAKAAIAANTDIIIGPLFASSVKAIAPLLAGREIPALAFSNDSSAAANNLWLLGFLPEQNISRIVSQAIAQGLTRFGALVPQGPYGERIHQSFVREVARFGGTVVQTETYPKDAKGMFDPVRRLAHFDTRTAAHEAEMARLISEGRALAPADLLARATSGATATGEPEELNVEALFKGLGKIAPELVSAYEALKLTETLGEIPYDAVFMPEGGLALRNLAPLLPYFDIDPRRVKFLGTALWNDPSLSQEPPLHGGWYAAPNPKNWAGFAARYDRVYGAAPPRLASMAYDGVSLAARLAAITPKQPFRTQILTNANGFQGIDGIVRLRQGGLNERGLAVQEITARAPNIVSREPASFVEHDRRVSSALSLAQTLKRENPDIALAALQAEQLAKTQSAREEIGLNEALMNALDKKAKPEAAQ